MEQHISHVKNKLRAYHQEHLLERLDGLPEAARMKLSAQIEHMELDQLFAAIEKYKQAASSSSGAHITPIAYVDWERYEEQEKQAFTERGWELLRAGAVGVVVVAGGNGSRLGHDGPKGTCDIGLPSGKSLFQLQAERLLHLSKRAGRTIAWYIMTSPDNHDATVAFFQAADFFGYPAEDCFIFQQNMMPAVDHDGKLLLSAEGAIKLAPSGNGECFASLRRSGALADMKQRGVEWLFYYNVDNALIKVADPAFIGVAAHYNNRIATKVIEKTNADEKIGIVCRQHGRPAVLEYNEIPESVSNERTKDGRLFYGLGHISIHLFKVEFIEEYADADIPYHVASKRLEYLDTEGQAIVPTEPNAYKLERFIFDFLPYADEITVLKVRRDAEFAPVKNKSGEDSPASARSLVLELHKKWLAAAGVPKAELQGRDIEISPLLSYSGEGLSAEDWEKRLS
ncbi:UDP-N-acetylglucosamine pyrophosphorylase [Paenibacillus sp. FSL H8-0548]|uniref:UTP--glucose-1-phosphate uridylyltransferase n=1 Tax=Paenibacillus sp. FSL H8-0548 TaxID=1920422 RepID=UPI00096C7F39|nr:UTP--glucose-1-phosphate uridylyltransferase [Paenibacillus sp. FSL H8-0548]OMF27620.1 UDP-N-acetylglucosamine pyrophosphorylase [Paenibacillus sp. FSL H8-0548]